MNELKAQIGIRCLSCGKFHLPPNHASLDNWTCNYCHSGLISIAMLTNLIPRDIVTQITQSKSSPTKARPCPKCHGSMDFSEVVDGENQVTLDLCRHCHLVWFDSGEMVKLLRLRPMEKFVEQEAPYVGVRARKKMIIAEERNDNFPTAMITILILATVYKYYVFPDFGMVLGPVFIVAGFFAEKRLGMFPFFNFVLVTEVVTRIAHIAMGGPRDPLFYTADHAFMAVIACALFGAPYREILFPKERYRSPKNAIVIFVVVVCTSTLIYLGYEYFHQAFTKVGAGLDGASSENTAISFLFSWMRSPDALPYAIAILLGFQFGTLKKS